MQNHRNPQTNPCPDDHHRPNPPNLPSQQNPPRPYPTPLPYIFNQVHNPTLLNTLISSLITHKLYIHIAFSLYPSHSTHTSLTTTITTTPLFKAWICRPNEVTLEALVSACADSGALSQVCVMSSELAKFVGDGELLQAPTFTFLVGSWDLGGMSHSIKRSELYDDDHGSSAEPAKHLPLKVLRLKKLVNSLSGTASLSMYILEDILLWFPFVKVARNMAQNKSIEEQSVPTFSCIDTEYRFSFKL
ncbi:hypothetical protein LguiB_014459 [Lonicera macranthoides]